MTARTADLSFQLPAYPSSVAKSEPLAVSNPPAPQLDNPIGAFRGLAYAILFQFLLGFVGYAGWELFRHLR